MTRKPLRSRETATRDAYQIVGYYEEEVSEALALRFAYALNDAYARLIDNPAVGSPLIGAWTPGPQKLAGTRISLPRVLF